MKKKIKMPRRTEQIILTDAGVVVIGKATAPGKRIRHHEENHILVSDRMDTHTGIRTISIKQVSNEEKAKFQALKKELINVLAEKSGEAGSPSFKKILDDVLSDNWHAHIRDLYRMVVKEGKSVKVKEGCFKIVIGDGRRKSSKEIMIRE